MQWLGHTVSAFSVWKGTAKLFHSGYSIFLSPSSAHVGVSPFLHSLACVWWDLLITKQESVSCPFFPQGRCLLETSFNSLLNSSIIATSLEVLLVPWGIFFPTLLFFTFGLSKTFNSKQNSLQEPGLVTWWQNIQYNKMSFQF